MLENVIIKHLGKKEDSRGWLAEIFRIDEISKLIIPEMGYLSITLPGISRGPHEHLEQTDYFCFPGISKFKISLWDNNVKSKTYGQNYIFETIERTPSIVVIPPKVVHAYKNIGPVEGIVINLPNKLYAGKNKKQQVDEVRYENLNNSKFKLE